MSAFHKIFLVTSNQLSFCSVTNGLTKRQCHSKTTNELLHKVKFNILRFPQMIFLTTNKSCLYNSLIFRGTSLKENMEINVLGDEREREQFKHTTFPICSRNFLSGLFQCKSRQYLFPGTELVNQAVLRNFNARVCLSHRKTSLGPGAVLFQMGNNGEEGNLCQTFTFLFDKFLMSFLILEFLSTTEE